MGLEDNYGFAEVIETNDLNALSYGGQCFVIKMKEDMLLNTSHLTWADRYKPQGIEKHNCYLSIDTTKGDYIYAVVSNNKPEAKCFPMKT